LKKAKGSEKKAESSQGLYEAINDKDKLANVLKDKKKTNEVMSREIAKRTQLILNTKARFLVFFK